MSHWLPRDIQLQHLNLLQRQKTSHQFESVPVGPFWLSVSESRRNTENQGNDCDEKILRTFFLELKFYLKKDCLLKAVQKASGEIGRHKPRGIAHVLA